MKRLSILMLSALLSGCVSSTKIRYNSETKNISEKQREKIIKEEPGYTINSHVLAGPLVNKERSLTRLENGYSYGEHLEGLGGLFVSGTKNKEFSEQGECIKSIETGDILGGLFISLAKKAEVNRKEKYASFLSGLVFSAHIGSEYNSEKEPIQNYHASLLSSSLMSLSLIQREKEDVSSIDFLFKGFGVNQLNDKLYIKLFWFTFSY